jgi:hypothetical protein
MRQRRVRSRRSFVLAALAAVAAAACGGGAPASPAPPDDARTSDARTGDATGSAAADGAPELPPEGCALDSDCDDGDPCTVDACRASDRTCRYGARPGADCEDGDPCTTTDRCDEAGVCRGVAVLCPSTDGCVIGRCDPATGECGVPAVDDTPCDDGDPCTVDDRCAAGVCAPGASACGGACETGACSAEGGGAVCAPAPDGVLCDDGDPDTLADRCLAGRCVGYACADPSGAAPACDPAEDRCEAHCGDGDPCDGVFVCRDGLCQTDPASIVTCAPPPDACHTAACDPASGVCVVAAVPDGAACEDGQRCTVADACRGGHCVGEAVVCPDEGDPCQLPVCDPADGACGVPRPDGTPCDDETICDGREVCRAGVCAAGPAPVLDDGEPCTRDTCHPSGGIAHAPLDDGAPCDDGDAETLDDACVAGRCVGYRCAGVAAGEVACSAADDRCEELCGNGDACDGTLRCEDGACALDAATLVDCPAPAPPCALAACDPQTGACVPSAAADGTPCADDDRCTEGDACLGGVCQGTPVDCAGAARACRAPVCDPATGACDRPLPDGTPCDDATVCNGRETCVGGACVGGPAPEVDDGDPCTADACDAAGGVTHEALPDGAPCDDGESGTVEDACLAGRCIGYRCAGVVSGAVACTAADDRCEALCGDGDACDGVLACRDGRCALDPATFVTCAAPADPCRTSRCDPQTGACVETPRAEGAPCDDGTVCNGRETCRAGVCTPGAPPDCASADPCRLARCDDALGCAWEPAADGTPCPDGDACDGDESCRTGECLAGPPPVCEAASACHEPACDPAAGCTERPVADGTPCDDGSACNGAETCLGGTCAAGPPLDCALAEACRAGRCDDALGCVADALPDETPCDDGDLCNGPESCRAGECAAGEPLVCEAAGPCTSAACEPLVGCTTGPVADGAPCDDGDEATFDDRCRAGLCRPGVPRPLSFLPDTGQTACYEADGAERPCGDPTSPTWGQDGDVVPNAPDLVAGAAGVLEDTLTGLSWEQDAPTAATDRRGAEQHCAGLTLAGRADWRLPTVRELLSIVDYGATAGQRATIDPRFTGTARAYYWTADADPSNDTRTVRVSFRYGTTLSQESTVADGYVRCVAGAAAGGAAPGLVPDLVPIEREAGVYDPAAGLFWQRVPSGNLPWTGALAYCNGLESQGFIGFRLPDVKELATLLRPDRADPVLDPDLFPGIRVGQAFWTSTTSNDPLYRDEAYTIALGDTGAIGRQRKADFRQALCVRPCPCPDPRCCFRCVAVPDGTGCDDGDPATYADVCVTGECVGFAEAPPAAQAPSFECVSLDCGPLGWCVVDGSGERCVCAPGAVPDGAGCRADDAPAGAGGCVPFDTGLDTVCLVPALAGPLPTAPPAARKTTPPRAHHISVPSGFALHDQGHSSLCYIHATAAGLEIQMGSRVEGLSEAHLVDFTGMPWDDAQDILGPRGKCSGFIGLDYGCCILPKLARGAAPAGCARHAAQHTCPAVCSDEVDYLVSDATWGVVYGADCARVTRPARPATTAMRAGRVARLGQTAGGGPGGLPDLASVKAALAAGNPVVAHLPFHPGDWNGLSWGSVPWFWRVIDSEWFDAPRPQRCVHGRSEPGIDDCWCLDEQDCPTDMSCSFFRCTDGGHAVLLTGYDDDDSGGRFVFLNSWGRWGHEGPSAGDPDRGFAKVSYRFVEQYRIGAWPLKGVRLACADPAVGCPNGDVRCAGNAVESCRLRDGCWEYGPPVACPAYHTCQGGHCIRQPRLGDGFCDAGETCANEPACRCDEETEVCQGGVCVGCSHDCNAGAVGCVDGTHRWGCGLAPDGDSCRDRIPAACAAGQVCVDGACVCRARDHLGCVGAQVWWFDSCGAATEYVRTCAGGETCSGGACSAVCGAPYTQACHDGDVYRFDSCGAAVSVVQSCGTSGWASAPRCSVDGRSVLRDWAERGCAGGACTSATRVETTACADGTCVDGQCGRDCGDGVCAPGEEDCASCPGDCSCWDPSAPVCSPQGRCVGCVDDGDCPSGATCQAGSCASGCHQCSPADAWRCDPATGIRQRCTLVFNCRMWVGSPCGWGEVCCDGGCSSTVAPPTQTLQAPAADATVAAGTVRFAWAYRGGANRVTLAVCRDQALTSGCVVREPPPSATSADVSLAAGTWYWSVRGITPCDRSGWGEYAAARRLTVGAAPAETCNGRDDDGDGRIDNVGAAQMGCLREIFAFERSTDPNNIRLQWNPTPGVAPAAPAGYRDPDWMAHEGRHPSFLLYGDAYGIAGLAKLYYCVRDQAPYDNLYTTSWQAECGSYPQRGESSFIGYLFVSDPGISQSYGAWLYEPWTGRPTRAAPLWRLRRPSTNQHQFTAFEGTITDRVGQGWCCERGPSYLCGGHWCGSANTTPVGWVLVPR